MKAASICIDLDTGETYATTFEGEDAILRCRAFEASLKDDWPGYVWTIASDEEAREAETARFLHAIGLED